MLFSAAFEFLRRASRNLLSFFLQGFYQRFRKIGSIIPETLPDQPIEGKVLDTEQITAKYKEERAKRIREDGPSQFLQPEGKLSHFKEDVWAPPLIRDPINAETKVLIVGAGFGGLVAGVKLKDQGVDDFLILEKGGGYGGTWYWNQYPGILSSPVSFENIQLSASDH
jgi:hypothetical protein